MFNNQYMLSTGTTIQNAGSGNNVLTKPAGTETASILPGRKYSNYLPSAATFETDFPTDGTNYSVGLYTKPNIGEVLSVDGNTVSFTGHSYVLANDVGGRAEIAVSSNRARLVVFTHSEFEAGMYIDWSFVSIPASTTDTLTPVTVSVLAGGGLADHIFASKRVLRGQEITTMLDNFLQFYDNSFESTTMTDDNRDFVERREIISPPGITLDPSDHQNIPLNASDSTAFKVEYELKGDGVVLVNGAPVASGFSTNESPQDIDIHSETGCTVNSLAVTEYYSGNVVSGSGADFVAHGATGNPLPAHLHDDNALTTGTVTVTPFGTVAAVSGWFSAENGMVLPDVSMYDGKLINAEFTGELWTQDTPPPAGATYRWTGTPHNSISEKVVDGEVVAVNHASDPNLTRRTTTGVVAGWGGNAPQGVDDGGLFSPGGATWSGLYADITPGYYAARVFASPESPDAPGTLQVRLYDGNTYFTDPNPVYIDGPQWIEVPTRLPTPGTLRSQVAVTENPIIVHKILVERVGGPGDLPGPYFDGDTPGDRANDLWLNTAEGNRPYTWDSMTNEWVVATTPNVYVNGKPYSGGEVRDWYFLTKVAPVSAAFDIDVPVHSIITSDTALSADQIDDLYELSFGNAIATAPADTISLSELPSLMLATEWNIVTSG